MTFIDNSLCASDCTNTSCLRHELRQIMGSPQLMSRQTWCNFSDSCPDYIKPDKKRGKNSEKGDKNHSDPAI